MPGFIKTPKDERKWNAIKHSVAKQRGKSVEDFSDRDWATVNAAWHKSEYEDIKKGLLKATGAIPKPFAGIKSNNSASMSNPMKTSIPSVKMPRPTISAPKAKQTGIDVGKSEFFKSEDVKHPTLCKLRDFLQKKHKAK